MSRKNKIIEDLEKPLKFPKSSKKDFENFPENKGYSKSPIRIKNSKKRVNITVDKVLLEEAKKKLDLFGGKLSTLFNVYLSDFVKSIEKTTLESHDDLAKRIKDLESRIKKLEDKIKS